MVDAHPNIDMVKLLFVVGMRNSCGYETLKNIHRHSHNHSYKHRRSLKHRLRLRHRHICHSERVDTAVTVTASGDGQLKATLS